MPNIQGTAETRAARDLEIWRAYCSGTKVPELIDRFGLAQARIYEIIGEQRDSIPVTERSAAVVAMAEVLDELMTTARGIMAMPPAPAMSEGRIVKDPRRLPPPGEHDPEEHHQIVDDYSGTLAALDRMLKVADAKIKLLGLAAPTKVEQGGATTVRYEVVGIDPEALR